MLFAQSRVTWTVCEREWSRGCRVPWGHSESPSPNSSSTSSSLGPNMKWPRSHLRRQRVLRPAAQDKSSEMESVVCFQLKELTGCYCFLRIYRANLCISSQWAVVWGHFIVGSKSSVSSVPLVHTRTRWDNFPVSHVPVLKDRESLVPRMCPSVEVIPIFSSLILRLFPFHNVRKSGY